LAGGRSDQVWEIQKISLEELLPNARRKYYICFAKLYGKDLDCLIDKGGQIVTFYRIIYKQLVSHPSDRCAYAMYIVGATHTLKQFHQHHLFNISFRLWSLNIVAL
jgi:hypothetical protein